MTHVTGAYFSPTGGTKRALEAVCSLFEGEAELLELTGPARARRRSSSPRRTCWSWPCRCTPDSARRCPDYWTA